MNDFIQVFMTAEKKEEAESIAGAVVEKRLAACAQVLGPIRSRYWWKDKVETSEEWLCIMKSRKALFENLEKTIREMHPYDVPEIVALPIVSGSRDYLKWLSKEIL
ncbi:MAG: divalent-cation tolerance protein CutA [Deltaproteobacteria bacterium]